MPMQTKSLLNKGLIAIGAVDEILIIIFYALFKPLFSCYFLAFPYFLDFFMPKIMPQS